MLITCQKMILTIALLSLGLVTIQAGVNYEEAPIHYRKTKPNNAISKLQAQIENGETKLSFDPRFGYLPALLQHLDIAPSSQVMPFAKVSRQNPKIGPQTPRAIYFNDEVHIGYVQEGLIEIAVTDPLLGMVFYTLDQNETERPVFRNESASCLTCHGTSKTKNVPGLQVRSMIPDVTGEPVLAAGSFRSDHSSPIEKRWGGWYVTGKHGAQKHLGNFTLPDQTKPKNLDNHQGQNITALDQFFDTSKYLRNTSDIVALMVLEHQADTINYITTANFETRYAQHLFELESQKNNADVAKLQAEKQNRVKKAGDKLLSYLLFQNETKLTAPLEGVSSFTVDFAATGKKDSTGRSLKDFDLQTRIFKYPCSYLIYSSAFASLPDEIRHYVLQQLAVILGGKVPDNAYAHLSAEDRAAIAGILCETHAEFASLWQQTHQKN
jgi:hypothetical protein